MSSLETAELDRTEHIELPSGGCFEHRLRHGTDGNSVASSTAPVRRRPWRPCEMASALRGTRLRPSEIWESARRLAITTIIVIHSSYTGGKCDWVGSELQVAGHDIHTPTLTGHGERVNPARPQVTLNTHNKNVVNVLNREDLITCVALVRRSYSGMGTRVSGPVGTRFARLPHDRELSTTNSRCSPTPSGRTPWSAAGKTGCTCCGVRGLARVSSLFAHVTIGVPSRLRRRPFGLDPACW